MSDPSVDLEKGITGLKEEKGITGLKEEKGFIGLKEEEEEEGKEKVVHQFSHLKVMCGKLLLDVYPVLFFVVVMFVALSFYRQTHIWWLPLVLLSIAIFNFWNLRRMQHSYIQHTSASADSDLSTTLLASSKN